MDWQEIEYQVFDSSKTKRDDYHFYKKKFTLFIWSKQ